MELWVLLISLIVILVGAETFTNALEHFGERLHISEGVTGSVFAAVGTALPEAMIPVVAVLAASGDLSVRHDVGVGAILGAPLMLSTITFFLMGTFAAQRRGWAEAFRPEPTGVHRDLDWFLFAFALATLALLHAFGMAMGTRVVGVGLDPELFRLFAVDHSRIREVG